MWDGSVNTATTMETSTTNVNDYLHFEETFMDPVTDDVREWFRVVNYVILCGLISLFGIAANIINITVFVRQGFKDSINISLLGLAVADLACSITMFWTGMCHNRLLKDMDLPFEPLDVMYATAGWPHVCFNRITSLITAFITLERCLCIAMPLKVKTLITPFRTKVIITSIFISMLVLFSPIYFVNKLEWKYNLSRNRTIIVLAYSAERMIVEGVTVFFHSVFLSSALLLSVTVCTIILVVKLNRKTKWRQTVVSQTSSATDLTSVKEKKVIKMITLMSTIFIVCYIPPTLNFLVMVFYSEYNYTGRLHNLMVATWSVGFVLDAINSSVNIFVYFNMSTKFKDSLCQLLFSKLERKS